MLSDGWKCGDFFERLRKEITLGHRRTNRNLLINCEGACEENPEDEETSKSRHFKGMSVISCSSMTLQYGVNW